MSDFNICIAGLGTVGSSLINIIEKNKNKIEHRLNKKIKIVGITAKNKRKKRSFLTDNYKWYDDPLKMIKDCKPNLFIELMGYEKEISYNSIKFAIKNKKAHFKQVYQKSAALFYFFMTITSHE